MNFFRGKVDCNAVLRGQTEVFPGDTFIDETRGEGFIAFQYTPLPRDSEDKAYKNFKTLHVGTFGNCERIAKSKLNDKQEGATK